MIPSPGTLIRVGLLVLLVVVLQLSAFSQITVFAGHVDLVVLVVAAVAYNTGSVPGSAAGFAAGFLLDLLSGATMGASSLALTAVGYGVGRLRELGDPNYGLLSIPVGAAATAGWVAANAAVAFLLGIGAPISTLLLRDMVVTVLLNALLALPVFAATRALLRPRIAPAPRSIGALRLRKLEA
jgi:rod shape-determining protein MreD